MTENVSFGAGRSLDHRASALPLRSAKAGCELGTARAGTRQTVEEKGSRPTSSTLGTDSISTSQIPKLSGDHAR